MRTAKFARWSLMYLVWLTVSLCGTMAVAQVDTGTISGTATDVSGAVVPGAVVTLTNQATAAAQTTKTNADGRYVFTPLHIGTYNVVVHAASFKKATIQKVQLSIQQQALVNVVLQPGATTETVEVTEAPQLMQTQSGSVGQVMESKEIQALPLNGPAWRRTIICSTASITTAAAWIIWMEKPM